MSWQLIYLPEAEEGLKRLDGSIKPSVIKGIVKVSQNPDMDGYGKPLGNKAGVNLAGLLKIKFKGLGIRVVYKLVKEDTVMKIIVVSARADNEVYELAAARRAKHDL